MKHTYKNYFLSLLLLLGITSGVSAQFGSMTVIDLTQDGASTTASLESLQPLLPAVEYCLTLQYDVISTTGPDVIDVATLDLTINPTTAAADITSPPTVSNGNEINICFTPNTGTLQLVICADDDSAFTFGSKAIFRTSELSVPVEFATFNGEQDNKEIALEWSTAIEVNNEKFEIQKAFGDSEWITIGEIQGAANSIRSSFYEFSDINPVTGVNFYRIKQIDFNGDHSYSDEINVVYFAETDIEIAPNPSQIGVDQPMMYIYSESATTANLGVYNISGQLINQYDEKLVVGQNRIAIKTGSISDGLYLVRLQVANHTETRKLYLNN